MNSGKHYRFSNDLGDAELTVYDVFPGVQLVYNSVHMDRFDLGSVTDGNVIEIHHCREGRIEQSFEDEYFYLTPGDFSIAVRGKAVKDYTFPLRHYHGITIGIREEAARQCFSQILADVQIQPMVAARHLCGDGHCHIIRAERYIEHIFSELYSVPEHIKTGYFKLKIMELFLVLSGIEAEKTQSVNTSLPRSQVLLANQVAAHLSERMDSHVTIAELSKRFGSSESQLKNVFKTVYGMPIFAYARFQRMQSAAQLLIHTERPVSDIAYELGYSNTGKFAAAFKDILGETPSEYRKAHTKGI